MSWTGTTFSHHINTAPAAVGSSVVQLAVRAYVLKGLMSIFRVQTQISGAAFFSQSKSSLQAVANYQYQIGSENYPQQQVSLALPDAAAGAAAFYAAGERVFDAAATDIQGSDAYAEVVRLMKGMKGSHSQGGGLINPEAYLQSATNNGAGIIGVSTEPYGADANIHNGIDTASTAMPVSLRYTTNARAAVIQQIDTYALCQIQFMRDADGNLSSEL